MSRTLATFAILAALVCPAPPPAPAQTPSQVEGEVYARGLQAISDEHWRDALEIFRTIESGPRADAALYWQAYALARLRSHGEALARIAELQRRFPSSRWLDDAAALEAEVAPERRIESPDAQVQLYAVTRLVDTDPEQALEVLADLLSGDGGVEIKRQALYVASRIAGPEARRLVERAALESDQHALRVAAIEYLGLFGDPEALEAIDRILETSERPEVGVAAVRGYGRAGAVDRLVTVVESGAGDEPTAEAARQLGHLKAKAELRRLASRTSDPAVRSAIVDGLVNAGDVEGLIGMITTEESSRVRRHAIVMLGSVGSPAATRALSDLYETAPDAVERRAVVEGLFRLGDRAALQRLAEREDDPALRNVIRRRIADLGPPNG